MFREQRESMVISTDRLLLNFGSQKVVKEVSLQVPAGCIYGFLGPNGAGKTTTIKLLLSLLHADNGTIQIFDKNLQTNRIAILSQIGSLIEQPAIYGHMTGRENLRNRALLLQVSNDRVDIILDLIRLKGAGDKKTSQYSLGMKQRLGIGLALLSDPQLIILDEPTNGLDPNGIIEVRQLLMRLVKEQGKTVFISSHLLAEIERMATYVGIINHGDLVFQGTIDELGALSLPQLHIEVSNSVDAANLLSRSGYNIADVQEGTLFMAYTSKEDTGKINMLLNQNGYAVYSIGKVQKDLEHLFLDITQNT